MAATTTEKKDSNAANTAQHGGAFSGTSSTHNSPGNDSKSTTGGDRATAPGHDQPQPQPKSTTGPATSGRFGNASSPGTGTTTATASTATPTPTQTGSQSAQGQTQGPKRSLRQRLSGMFRRTRQADPHATGTGQGQGGSTSPGGMPVQAEPEAKAVEDNRRDASIQQLRRGFNETMETMKAVRTHMEDHSRRSQRMVELLEGLNGLPEASRQQTTVLRDVQKGIESGNKTSGELSQSVENLSQATAKQDQALSKLDERLGTQDQVRQSLDNLSSSLTQINKTQTEAQEAYTRDMKQTREAVAQGRKTMITVGIITSVLAAGALGVAIYAVYAVSFLSAA